MTTTIRVADLMTEGVITVRPFDTLEDVFELMSENKIRHIPVVNADGELEGLVTHRDLVGKALFAMNDVPLSVEKNLLRETRVSEAMTVEPDTIEADASLSDAARIILENKYGCLPVMENTKLVGIITEADFVKYTLQQLGD
ncbi:MAG TPA: CBS domain-containing protein [Anaerolineaceae bacterium]|nr:CBS domain-containing protein [Anaerolineaceae bacterium]